MKESLGKISWEIGISFVAAFGTIWLILEPLDLTTGFKLWLVISLLSIAFAVGYTGIRLMWNYSKIIDNQFCEVNDPRKLKELIKNSNELRIFASGSETYRTPLLNYLKECDLPEKLNIKVLVRDDNNPRRADKIVEAREKWSEIDENYNTKTEIRSYDFKTALRGMIFGNTSAILGWYYRKNSKTLGQTYPVFHYSNNNNNSKKVIEFAIKTFDDIYENATQK